MLMMLLSRLPIWTYIGILDDMYFRSIQQIFIAGGAPSSSCFFLSINNTYFKSTINPVDTFLSWMGQSHTYDNLNNSLA